MTAVLDAPTITSAGVYDLADEVYHADPVPGGSLSSTGARKILPPNCPALFRHWADNPPATKREFDLGHAAHKLALGAGNELAVLNFRDYKTNAAKDARAAATAAGHIPLLTHEHELVLGMAAALRAHPLAARLFAAGQPERSLFWTDPATGTWCRARLDWLPDPGHGRTILADYKTTTCAEPGHLRRTVWQYGYHQQAAWYLTGLDALGLADDAAFLFVFQEKQPPYLVTVAELDATALRIGAERNRWAIDTYADCVSTGTWPDYRDHTYQDGIVRVALPAWAENQHLEDL